MRGVYCVVTGVYTTEAEIEMVVFNQDIPYFSSYGQIAQETNAYGDSIYFGMYRHLYINSDDKLQAPICFLVFENTSGLVSQDRVFMIKYQHTFLVYRHIYAFSISLCITVS